MCQPSSPIFSFTGVLKLIPPIIHTLPPDPPPHPFPSTTSFPSPPDNCLQCLQISLCNHLQGLNLMAESRVGALHEGKLENPCLKRQYRSWILLISLDHFHLVIVISPDMLLNETSDEPKER